MHWGAEWVHWAALFVLWVGLGLLAYAGWILYDAVRSWIASE